MTEGNRLVNASFRVGRTAVTAAALALGISITACDPPSLESLSLPAPSVGWATYTLKARFANALNLPERAKVRLGGADVGEVESIEAVDYVAEAKLRIRSGVRLPVGSTAQLRSATPLGDVFVALDRPVNPSADLLKNGETLGLQSTSAAASVEGVLGSAAVLVNGGVIRDLTHLVNGLGNASNGHGQTFGELVAQSNQMLDKLDRRSEHIAASLEQTHRLIANINSRQTTLNDLLAAAGPAAQAVDASRLGDLVDRTGQISDQFAKLPSIQGTDTRSTITDLNSVAKGFSDIVGNPDTSLVALNRLIPVVMKDLSGSSVSLDVNIAKLALGNWPDAGYKGDPSFHGPKQADWGYLIGSVKYSLYRLQERVLGQGPNPQAPDSSTSDTPPGG